MSDEIYLQVSFESQYNGLLHDLIYDGEVVNVGEWQSTKVDHPLQQFQELQFCRLKLGIPSSLELLQQRIKPDLPWAEAHFQERVSGIPFNPPPSEKYWPWRDKTQDNVAFTTDGQKFSHTYPERYWPKQAGGEVIFSPKCQNCGSSVDPRRILWNNFHYGIRYQYGDLNDVVAQLKKSPLTRQAYLPVWFPEDTGAVHEQRVPCSLGYHFLIRNDRLHCAYYIRSCDFLRHLRNDVYMTARLMQWVVGELQDVLENLRPGVMHMHVSSLHCFVGDIPRLKKIYEDTEEVSYGTAI